MLVFAGAAAVRQPSCTHWLAAAAARKLPAGGQLIAVESAVAVLRAGQARVLRRRWCMAMPWLLYQAWAFVAPGLYKREKRLALPLLVSAVALFYTGCAFAYFLVLPAVFGFLTKVTPDGVAMMTDIGAYLDFVLVIFLAFGASFELPVALVILVLLGWVTPKQLREWRGYAVVGIFVVAAVITPPDVVSQLMLAIPMCCCTKPASSPRASSRRGNPMPGKPEAASGDSGLDAGEARRRRACGASKVSRHARYAPPASTTSNTAPNAEEDHQRQHACRPIGCTRPPMKFDQRREQRDHDRRDQHADARTAPRPAGWRRCSAPTRAGCRAPRPPATCPENSTSGTASSMIA